MTFGLFAHLYKFMNYLPNHDALYCVFINPPNAIGSGRWLLDAACNLSSTFDLPWIRGLMALFWIGLTAAVITDIFRVENRFVQILIGGLLVTFPAVTNTFFFEFNADAYMLAMLFSALAVRFSSIGDSRAVYHVVAVLCICCCCGIYQAYLSFAVVLALCYLMSVLLSDERSGREIGKWIGKEICVFLAGLLLYYLIWRVCLLCTGGEINPYQGMDGSAAGFHPVYAIQQTVKTLLRFFLGGDVRKNGWTLYAALNTIFLIGFIVLIIYSIKKSKLVKRPGMLLLFLFCLLLIPFAVCIWFFMSASVEVHMLMLQSIAVIYIFCLVMTEEYAKTVGKQCASAFFLLLIFKFSLQANMSYFEMELCEKRTEATATEILSRIHDLDDGTVKRIALIAGGDQSLVAEGAFGINEILVHAHQLRSNLIFDHNYASMYLSQIMGSDYQGVSGEKIIELEESGLAEEMPSWPLAGSVQIVGDIAVVHLPSPEVQYYEMG